MDVMTALLAGGTAVNHATVDGGTPLFFAAQQGHMEVVEALLAAGAAVNQSTLSGATPLYMAAQCGHAGVVRALLWAGADVSLARKGTIPLEIARHNGHAAIADLLTHPERHTRAAAVAVQREATANRAAVGVAVVLRRAGPIALPPVPPPLPPGAAPAVAPPPAAAAAAFTVSARALAAATCTHAHTRLTHTPHRAARPRGR
jgi:hypothetical protein